MANQEASTPQTCHVYKFDKAITTTLHHISAFIDCGTQSSPWVSFEFCHRAPCSTVFLAPTNFWCRYFCLCNSRQPTFSILGFFSFLFHFDWICVCAIFFHSIWFIQIEPRKNTGKLLWKSVPARNWGRSGINSLQEKLMVRC